MSDLDRLIDAVEAWDADFLASDGWIEAWDAVAPSLQTYRMKSDGESAAIASYAAYNGSLDAAHRLHEALLPGHTRAVDATAPEMGIRIDVWSPEGPITGTGDHAIEARAWLLAILRAVKAQEGR